MSDAALRDSAVADDVRVVTPPTARPDRRRLPFAPRTALAVGAALALAVGGAVWIALPKPAESTDAAYVEADSTVVAPKVRGLVAEVLVAHNQRVRAGQPLLRIDPEEFDARVAAANADLLNAQANVAGAKAALISLDAEQRLAAANVRAAQTQIGSADAQSTRAAADQKRYDALVASGAVARRDADQYRAAAVTAASDAARSRALLDVSRNQASVTEAKRATLEANLAQAVAGVARAQAALDLARQDQGHALIRSPIDGVVGDRQVEVGDYVQPGTRLMTVAPLAALYVTANFKETQTGRMTAGQPATIKVDALPGVSFTGHVDSSRQAPARSSRCCRSSPARVTSPRSFSGFRCASGSTAASPTWRACGRDSRPR
ncbi:MAG TPA: HlyD family secretion protein [Caulobacteraceae bacterium]|jgi:membrane fusion protein (multidrug efflux system)|nr:HlyD family secretion protein [Caulobacteraceae bacterium]